MARKKEQTVLTGSELNGADQEIAEWAGLEVPDDRSDEYVDLVGGVALLQEFFETISNGTFAVTEEEDDMGPGLNDTYWEVTTDDQEALKAEIRERLTEELGLQRIEPPKSATLPRKKGPALDDRARCSVCETPEAEGCQCNPLSCPICGKTVSAFNEDFGVKQCEHTVAWGVTGNDDINWLSNEWQAKFEAFCADNEDGPDSCAEPFAEKTGLVFDSHDDGEGHGFGRSAFFLFSASKKEKPRKRVKKKTSPGTRRR